MGFDYGVEKAEKKFGVGGSKDQFEFVPGKNVVRVLSVSDSYVATHFTGPGNKTPVVCRGEDEGCELHGENAPVDKDGKPRKPSVKKLMYVYSKEKKKIEVAFMPYSVVIALQNLANDDEWVYDSMPMPYDININYDPEASPAKMYSVLPSPKRVEVPQTVLAELLGRKPLKEIEDAIKGKQGAVREEQQRAPEPPPATAEEISVDDIPF